MAMFLVGPAWGESEGVRREKNDAQISRSALDRPNSADRHQEIHAILSGNRPADREELRRARDTEPNPHLRYKLNQALVAAEVPEAAAELIESLTSDTDGVVRQGAAQELGNYYQTPGVVEALAESFDREPILAVKSAIARSLALSDTLLSRQALEKASRDSSPDLRRQAAHSLAHHKSRASRQILRKLERDRDPGVRAVARGAR